MATSVAGAGALCRGRRLGPCPRGCSRRLHRAPQSPACVPADTHLARTGWGLPPAEGRPAGGAHSVPWGGEARRGPGRAGRRDPESPGSPPEGPLTVHPRMSRLRSGAPSPLPASALQGPANHRSVDTAAPTLPTCCKHCSCEQSFLTPGNTGERPCRRAASL